eukprot:65527-Rhodomonas_salina.1
MLSVEPQKRLHMPWREASLALFSRFYPILPQHGRVSSCDAASKSSMLILVSSSDWTRTFLEANKDSVAKAAVDDAAILYAALLRAVRRSASHLNHDTLRAQPRGDGRFRDLCLREDP